MICDIPEEILYHVLTYCICVDVTDRFLRFRRWPPLQRVRFLLVSKQWLRVGTPLLYDTIELFEEPQVEQLAWILRSHPDLGFLVRNLRLQQCYGRHLSSVVKRMPNVRSLSIDAQVRTRNKLAALGRALPLLNPTELYIHGVDTSSKGATFLQAVYDIMPQWSSLEHVFIPLMCRLTPEMANALRCTPSLRRLSIYEPRLKRALLDGTLHTVALNPAIEKINCYGTPDSLGAIMEGYAVPEDVRNLIVYEEWGN